jgi:hypothetical protein
LLFLLGAWAGAARAQLATSGAQLFVEDDIGFYGPANGDHFAAALATGDFDGDGAEDLATGVPADDNAGGGYSDSGIVIIRYGARGSGLATAKSFDVLSQFNGGSPDPVEANDFFGWALAAGDFNGDGYDDLAVGALGDGTNDGGAVQIHYGTAGGLDLSGLQHYDQDSPGIAEDASGGDWFGFALATGDFDNDGYDDLAIGVPHEDIFTGVGLVDDCGAVEVLYGSSVGLSATRSQYFDQNVSGMADTAEDNDEFGWSLAAGDFNGDDRDDLAIGVDSEDNYSGAVQVLYGSAPGLTVTGNQFFSQDSPGIADSEESFDAFGWAVAAGDFDHDGFDDLAIGVPREGLDTPSGNRSQAGAVEVLPGSAAGLTATGSVFLSQATAGMPGTGAGSNNQLGIALATGHFDADLGADLAIGAFGADLGHGSAEGEVVVIYGNPSVGGLTSLGAQLWTQDTPGAPGVGEGGDWYGEVLEAGDFNGDGLADLVIGAPREDWSTFTEAGAETILYGNWPPLPFADDFETGGLCQWNARFHGLGSCS